MRIIKTVKQHRPYPKKQALSALFSKNGCCLLHPYSFVPIFPILFLSARRIARLGVTLSRPPPRAIDDVNEDTVFSPNGDGVQDTLLIGFITDGDFGDFRIIY